MNILITLPKNLIEKIISGEKKFEMRKCLPQHMKIRKDGFFVVEKGTNSIRCWCRVDEVRETYIDHNRARLFSPHICVPEEYIENYAKSKKVYLWRIGKVIALNDYKRDWLYIFRNPQQYAYCPLSYGEMYL